MLINEIINELSFAGSRCTKDCSGHKAGYRWAMRRGANKCNSRSQSFNNGCNIASNQMQAGVIKTPKVRDDRGKFYFNPR